MERATKEFTTSGGHKVVIKTYATGREFQMIQDVYLAGTKINVEQGEVKVDGFNVGSESKAREKTIELLVVSFDGDTKDVVNKIYDLPYQETEEILKELNEVSGKKKTA